MKKLLLITTAILFGLYVNAQIVNIPDSIFKIALINHIPVIDTNGDGEIQQSEASSFTDEVNVFDGIGICTYITDLTGIEAFTAITSLNCGQNQLTTLDVSNNVALTSLNCGHNPLTFLDISNNPNLTYLACYWNQLNSLDVSNNLNLDTLMVNSNQIMTIDVSNNVNLLYFDCSNNLLDTINTNFNINLTFFSCAINNLVKVDISHNTALTYFDCGDNLLTSIDVSNNTSLIQLHCVMNQFNTIDVSNNLDLYYLRCRDNLLQYLDLSNNTSLSVIECWNNQLTSLDLSNNSSLEFLACQNNLLNELNVKNGNNTLMVALFGDFMAYDNPDLYCIEVDDSTWSTANWTNIDSQSYFSENCMVGTPEQLQTPQLSIYPNPTTGPITIKNEELRMMNVAVYDIYGKEVLKQEVGSQKYEVDLSTQPNGIYIVKVITDKQAITKKIIKQ